MPEGNPLVAIIMGSQSDWTTMKHAADTLDALDVPYEARIVSAHRTPEVDCLCPSGKASVNHNYDRVTISL